MLTIDNVMVKEGRRGRQAVEPPMAVRRRILAFYPIM